MEFILSILVKYNIDMKKIIIMLSILASVLFISYVKYEYNKMKRTILDYSIEVEGLKGKNSLLKIDLDIANINIKSMESAYVSGVNVLVGISDDDKARFKKETKISIDIEKSKCNNRIKSITRKLNLNNEQKTYLNDNINMEVSDEHEIDNVVNDTINALKQL